jgi:hypothetical protein
VSKVWKWFWGLVLVVPLATFVIWAIWDNTKLFFITLLNGLTLSSLYFIVAAGFTLVFGLMRNVNLAHGSLYLLGGYIGYFVAEATGYFVLALAAGFLGAALVGLVMQVAIFRFMPGQDLRQTMVTIGLSIIIADLLIWGIGATVHQMSAPDWLAGPLRNLPVITPTRSTDGAAAARDHHRRAVVALPEPHAHRHDDPRRCGRPRHARGHRGQRQSGVCGDIRHRCRPRRLRWSHRCGRAVDGPGEDVRLLLASSSS